MPGAAELSVLSKKGRDEFWLGVAPNDLCLGLDSTGTLVAFTDAEERLQLRTLAGTGDSIHLDCQGVVDARFDGRGRLWTVRRGPEQYVVEVRTPGAWQSVAEAGVSDAYYLGGGAMLGPGTTDDCMIITAYSGQSETENQLCELGAEGLKARQIGIPPREQFPFTRPGAAAVLVLDHDTCEISKLTKRYEDAGQQIAWPFYDECEGEDERPGYAGCFVGDDHFLAGSQEGRLFLIKADPLCVLTEIVVDGHEPIPLATKYPTLPETGGWGSDLQIFGAFADSVAATFAKDHRSARPVLVVLRVADILG